MSRWSWPWSRQPPQPAAGPPAGGGSVSGSTRGGGTTVPPAWRGLPPVQRTVDDMPVTAPVSRLTSALASWGDPRSVAPLGHLVDPEGPSGRVEGLVMPVGRPASWSGGHDLAVRQAPSGGHPVQR